MRKIWVVVANRSDAKIYYAENVHTLVEKKSFVHNEAHLHDKDIVEGAKGRVSQRFFSGTDTYSSKTSVQNNEASLFATEICKYLEEACNAKECERIYLVAKPPFLGFLHDHLHPNVRKLIASEIQKDIVSKNAAEIRTYLPPVL